MITGVANSEYFFRFYDGKVIIEDDVFIGANAVIAKPVRIEKGSIIGANVVVTKDIKTSSVYTGTNNSQLWLKLLLLQ